MFFRVLAKALLIALAYTVRLCLFFIQSPMNIIRKKNKCIQLLIRFNKLAIINETNSILLLSLLISILVLQY